MLATLIPLFDEHMVVKAYSLFAQKKNYLLNPSFLGTGYNDGAMHIAGLEIIESMGIETLSEDKEVFVEVNQFSIFMDVEHQCSAPPERLVLLADNMITPQDMYIERIKELKKLGYRMAIRKLPIEQFAEYREILLLMDYILLDYKRINIANAKIFFDKMYPNMKVCVVDVDTQDDYDKLKKIGRFDLYEGGFFRMPVPSAEEEVAPLKSNYIELLNIVNDADFDLSEAADVVGRDTALVISLLKMVNHMSRNSEITSIRHAAAMLGQKELKKWINTAVTNELCADKPSEITRLSLLRAKFAENMAPVFDMAGFSSELFLMGLFSVLDLILDKPMEEALSMVKVSKQIWDALVNDSGDFAPVLDFIEHYETASWQEVSRQMVVKSIEMDAVYEAYIQSLQWYRELFRN